MLSGSGTSWRSSLLCTSAAESGTEKEPGEGALLCDPF